MKNNITEKDKTIIRKAAEEMACNVYFCNVGQDDWPEEPLEKLAKGNFHDEEGTYEMIVWEPLEWYSPEQIKELVEDTAESIELNIYNMLEKLDICKGANK